jgi:multidrug efflux pump subunit AcrA (membrane-fusion protein)
MENEKNAEKKKMSKITQMLIIGAVAVILIIGPSLLAGDDKVAEASTDTASYSVRTQQVARQTLDSFLDVNGDIVSTVQADVLPDAAGILVSVRVNLGSYVRKGEIVIKLVFMLTVVPVERGVLLTIPLIGAETGLLR